MQLESRTNLARKKRNRTFSEFEFQSLVLNYGRYMGRQVG